MSTAKKCVWSMFASVLLCSSSALAQWTTQELTLQPGWNAVYLEVQPEPRDPDKLFASVPIESVWIWNRRFSTVQFIQDPNQLVPGQPDWLTYLPPDHPGRTTRSLFSILGGHTYLVKLRNSAAPMIWRVTGRPSVQAPEWIPGSFNMAGFPVAANGGPTFQSFFAGSAAHSGQAVYRLNSSGVWALVATPGSASLKSGEAFWIYCKGASTFSGPLDLTFDHGDGLNYGRLLTEQTIRIRNASAAPRTITLQEINSQPPPDSAFPVLAGAVPLAFYQVDAPNKKFGWVPLPAQLQKANLQPGEEWVVRLQVSRANMAAFTPPAVHNGVLYQSLLQVGSDDGTRYLVPVSADGLKTYAPSGAGLAGRASTLATTAATDERAGLWVGNAIISKVSQPARAASPDTPIPVSSRLEIRLILHVDSGGTVRLLQKVLQMFKEGTLKPDPADPSRNIIDQPGRYVLVTDDTLIPQFTGVALRDGQVTARRISSAAFSHPVPIPFSPGTAGARFGAGTFTGQVKLDFDDRLNPFKHVYHPDHNNLDERFQEKLPESQESFSVSRAIELEFTKEDPDSLTTAGWGDDQLGGMYRETITGLHRQAIHLEGTFRLVQISRVPQLNDGNAATLTSSR